jgi:hypothetical protein
MGQYQVAKREILACQDNQFLNYLCVLYEFWLVASRCVLAKDICAQVQVAVIVGRCAHHMIHKPMATPARCA